MAAATDLRGVLRGADSIGHYIMAGNATITLRSLNTGARFTYKIRRPNEDTPYFVNLLRGPDNEVDYSFLGTIFSDGTFRHGRKSMISEEAPSVKTFTWFHRNLMLGKVSNLVEVWHEGRCGRCGRKLTVPESVEAGLGPECASKG